MAIIEQKQTITHTVLRATTIADAVRMDTSCDYWKANLAEGTLRDAMIKNTLTGAVGSIVRDKNTMELCSKYGRLFQV